MAATFSRTLRALQSDRPRVSTAAVLLSLVVAAGWLWWFTRAEVSLNAVTDRARVEVEARAYAVDAPASGRVVRMEAQLDHEVSQGEALVILDSELEQRQLAELQARIRAIEPQLEAGTRELAAQKKALDDQERATLAALDEGRARLEEARAAQVQADDEAHSAQKMLAPGAITVIEAHRLASLSDQRHAAADAQALELEKLQRDQRTRGSQGLARVEELRRALASLEGERTAAEANIRVIEETIARDTVHAPVSGRIGEVAPINAGAYVKTGDRLFSVVPPGELRAVADFVPADALGRVRPGQDARLRLDGFPWMQYGTVPATVSHVGSELRDGRVRVELQLHVDPSSAIPMQHGLPAIAEVDVERVTPARLVLRQLGALLHPVRDEAR